MFFLREDGAPARKVTDPARAELRADTPIALREDGPFEPLAAALIANGALRDVVAAAIPIPSLRDHARTRLVLLAANAIPMAMLLELDRELVAASKAGLARVVVDAMIVAWVVFELTRRTPRIPAAAAAALVAVAFRWSLVAARTCGHGVAPLVYAGAVVAAASAFIVLARVPSPGRVALELASKLGISRPALAAASRPAGPPGALVAAAVACAAALPALLHLLRLAGAGLVVESSTFVAFAVLAPIAARRATDPEHVRAAPAPAARILMGTVAGFAIACALVTVGRLFFDVGAELARCVARLDAEARIARAAEASELVRAITRVRTSAALVVMTTAAFPFAEERVYRGLLQDVLVRRYGARFGVLAASLAFGVAHAGVYHVALYQTVLLGIGFGVAFAEGGIVAAFLVHATWNLLQLA